MKEFERSVSNKGQITLPLEIRRQFGIRPKDKVIITIDGDEVRVLPRAARRLKEFYQTVPALQPPRTLDEMTEIAHDEQAQEAAREGLVS